MSHPDAVVIGAGVIGASCAVHLARAGLRVTVIDRSAAPGTGSTGRATGGVPAPDPPPPNIPPSPPPRAPPGRFPDATPAAPAAAPGSQRAGYLGPATTAANLAELRAAHQLQRREGLDDAVLLAPADVPAINRFIALDGVAGAAWCPSDGVMRPTEILRGYLAAAERLGVALRWGEPAVAVDRDPAGRITAVATPPARHPAPVPGNPRG